MNNNALSSSSSHFLLQIKPTIFKELIKYIPIKRFLLIISTSKLYQQLFNINIQSYRVLFSLSHKRFTVLDPKTVSELYDYIINNNQSASLDEVASGFCLYFIFLQNKLRLKHLPVYLDYPELYLIYKTAVTNFQYTFDINVSPFDDNMIVYPDQSEEFVNHYKQFLKQITFTRHLFHSYNNKNKKIHLEQFLMKIRDNIHQISFCNNKFTSNDIDFFNIINKCFNSKITQCDFSYLYFCIPILKTITKMDLNNTLTSLKLVSCKLYFKSLDVLSHSHCYSKLLSLNLSNNKIGDEGMVKLANNSFFPSLIKLNLSYNKITHKGICTLTKSSLITLQTLNLEGNDLSGSAKYLFNNSTTLVNLNKLNVVNCNLSDSDFESMSNNHLVFLKKLYINKNEKLGKNCLLVIFCIKSLEYVDLSETGIDFNQLLLTNSSNDYSLKSLYCLSLSHNKKITSNALIEVFERNLFPNIHSIDLFNDNVDDEFIDYITNNKPKQLELINVHLNPLISNEARCKCYSMYKKLNKPNH